MTPNPSLVLNKVDDITFETYDAPTITDPHDVLVQVKKTGICGSDIHYYAHGKIGPFVLKSPMVLGHESSGTVVEVGSAVKDLKPGDNVAIEPGVPSRLSDEYKQGKYNLCPHMCFAATPSADGKNPPGTLCKYFKSPQDFLVKLPEQVTLEMGALVEPLSVGVHAARVGGIKFGDVVAVFGAGPVGILAAAVAKKFGASKVIIVDIFDNKLEMAKEMGVATHTFNSKTGGDYKKLIEELGQEPNVVLECTGAEPCIRMGVFCLARGGKYIQVGNAPGDVTFPITEFGNKELTLFGTFRYGYGDYKTAVGILAQNYASNLPEIDFEKMITHRLKWEDAIKAYDLVRAGNGAVKCIISGPE